MDKEARIIFLEGQLAKVCAALGFGHLEQKAAKDGTIVNVSNDAYYNLMGALDDLTNSNGNDEITRGTIDRVISQLGAAKVALERKPDSPSPLSTGDRR